MDISQLASERRIFTCRAGSHLYGLNTANSDEDTRGVFVGAPANLLGLFPVEHCQYDGDYIVYELSKFVTLARDCNPNIIELLWVPDSETLFSTPIWEKLRQNRDLFLSRRAKFTFSGYATAQLKKIRGHNRWLHNPQPVEPPLQAKFIKTKWIEGIGNTQVFDQNAYDEAHKKWQQYHEWKRNRNPARAAMEAEFGFDGKHAAHMIRLLRMGVEILRGEGVIVKRPDRDELLAIRAGKWTFEEVVAMGDELQAQMDALYESSTLPKAPDVQKISDLTVELYREDWRARGEF